MKVFFDVKHIFIILFLLTISPDARKILIEKKLANVAQMRKQCKNVKAKLTAIPSQKGFAVGTCVMDVHA